MPGLPLGAADSLQQNTDTNNGATSVEVSLPAGTQGTQAGKTVLILVEVANSNAAAGAGISTPTGFTGDQFWSEQLTGVSNHAAAIFRKSNTSAGEGVAGSTGWTLTSATGASVMWSWLVLEVDRLDLTSPKVGSGGSDTILTANPATSGSTGSLSRNDTFVVGMVGGRATMTTANLAAYDFTTPHATSDPYTVVAEQRTTNASGSANLVTQFMRSIPFPDGTPQTYYVTSTGGGNGDAANDTALGVICAYASAGSGTPDPLDYHHGFEQQTYGGLATAPTAARQIVSSVLGTLNTDILVGTSYARTGTGLGTSGCRVVQSAAAKYVRVDTNKFGTGKTACVLGIAVRPQSGSGVVVLYEVNPAAGTTAQLVYNHSTNQLGLRWGSGGTVSYQQQTTALNAYVWVDWKVSGLGGATWTQEWYCEESGLMIEQDGPADLTSQTATTLASFNWGGNLAQTSTFDTDDICMSATAANYPLGKTKILLLTVDQAGTVTTTNSALFNTFSANGTLAAWNATTARGAVDEVPPNYSATSDGVVQVTAGTGTVTFPFTTYTLAAGEVFYSAALMYALWANSTQTANIVLATELTPFLLDTTTSFNPGNAPAAISATVPSWAHGKRPSSGGWTQTQMDGLTTSLGNSSDATPDIGVTVAYAEVAVLEALPATRIYGPDADGLTVDVTRSGGSQAVETYEITAGATRNATLRYVKDDAETNQTITAGSGTSSVTIAADYGDQVSRVTIEPDPVS